jgi:hypothetical protein
MHGLKGPLTSQNATPNVLLFLLNSSVPCSKSTCTPMMSPLWKLAFVAYSYILPLLMIWPLTHVMPHSLAPVPRWACSDYIVGAPVTPTTTFQVLVDAIEFKSICTLYE